MTIIKTPLEVIPFSGGVPTSPEKTQIEWMINGESPTGADPLVPGSSDGVLNRPALQVETNVETLDLNQQGIKEKIDEIIDVVNIHDSIINSGDGLDLYQRVDNLETKTDEIDLSIYEINDHLNLVDGQIASLSDTIGVGDPTMQSRTLRADDIHIKQMLGNYSDFDMDGKPSPGSTAVGAKGQIERNWKTAQEHDVRITSLEKWWEDSTPASLMEEVNQIRDEIGPTFSGDNINERLESMSLELSMVVPTTSSLTEHTGMDEFPLQYFDVQTENYVEVDTLYDYSIKSKSDIDYVATITKNQVGIVDDLSRSLGTAADSTLDTTAWGRINDLRSRTSDIEGILGASPLDGLQGQVKTVDEREAIHYSSLDNRINTLNNTVNVDYRTRIGELEDIVSDPNDGLYVKTNGTGEVTDPEFDKIGSWSASKQMYDNMYLDYTSGQGFIINPSTEIPDAVWSREYDETGSTWVWRNIHDSDFILGQTKKITTTNNVELVSYTSGDDGNYIPIFGHDPSYKVQIRGQIIGNLNLDVGSDIRKFNSVLLGATAQTVSLGQVDKSTLIVGKDVNSIKYKTPTNEYEILHLGNYQNFISDVNPQLGFVMQPTAKIGYAGVDVIKLDGSILKIGSSNVTTNIDSLVNKLDMNIGTTIRFKIDDTTNRSAISNVNNDLVFGDTVGTNILAKDFYVRGSGSNLYRVWHDGMDAPSDGGYYARKDGQWAVFNPNGGSGGGIGDEVPQTGKPYVRVNVDGVGFWEESGSRDITLRNDSSIKTNTNSGVLTVLSTDKATLVTSVGVSSGKVHLVGVVNDFVVNSKISTPTGGSLITQQATKIEIGDPTKVIPTHTPGEIYVGHTNQKRVWHDGMDAPSDGNFYSRRNNTWSIIHDGVDPTKNVVINEPNAYKIGNLDVAKVVALGVDKQVVVGDPTSFIKIDGKLTDISLAPVGVGNSFGISSTVDSQSVNIISVEQPATEKRIKVGDALVPLRMYASDATLNDDKILTENEFEAPIDGKKYVRQDGVWTPAYYYGDFATEAPSSPKEGDVFFEFIN